MTATLASVLAFGWLLIMGAVLALIQAFQVRSWSGFLLFFLSALLRGFAGYLLVRYPLEGEYGLTLLLASLFIVGGVFRAFGASALQFPQWGWAVVSGIVSVALGRCCSRTYRSRASGSSDWLSVSISFSTGAGSLPSAQPCAVFRAVEPLRVHERHVTHLGFSGELI